MPGLDSGSLPLPWTDCRMGSGLAYAVAFASEHARTDVPGVSDLEWITLRFPDRTCPKDKTVSCGAELY